MWLQSMGQIKGHAVAGERFWAVWRRKGKPEVSHLPKKQSCPPYYQQPDSLAR
jgi:hypothetical protein